MKFNVQGSVPCSPYIPLVWCGANCSRVSEAACGPVRSQFCCCETSLEERAPQVGKRGDQPGGRGVRVRVRGACRWRRRTGWVRRGGWTAAGAPPTSRTGPPWSRPWTPAPAWCPRPTHARGQMQASPEKWGSEKAMQVPFVLRRGRRIQGSKESEHARVAGSVTFANCRRERIKPETCDGSLD